MFGAPPQPSSRRNFLDGGFTMALLAAAIVAGYGILASTPARAKTVATPPAPPAATIGAIVTAPAERPAPLASTPETTHAPEPPRPFETPVALARRPANLPEPLRPRP